MANYSEQQSLSITWHVQAAKICIYVYNHIAYIKKESDLSSKVKSYIGVVV